MEIIHSANFFHMKRASYPILILIALSIGLTSCSIDPLAEYEPIILEGQDYLDRYDTPVFFYHYAEKNTLTNETKGWVIDNEGYLRSYENIETVLRHTNHKSTMRNFLAETKVEHQVDLVTLVANYKKNLTISRTDLITEELDAQQTVETTFYGFALSYPDAEDLGSCSPDTRLADYYHQYVLESNSNNLMQTRDHTAAQAILSYLRSVALDQEDN